MAWKIIKVIDDELPEIEIKRINIISYLKILLLIDKLEPNNLGIGSIETKTTINKVIIDKYIPIKPKLLNHWNLKYNKV